MGHKDNLNKILEEIRVELNTIVIDNSISSPEITSARTSSTALKLSNASARSNQINSDLIEESDESEANKNARFLNVTASQNIDDDIQRMRIDLKRSYELFKNAGDTLESISFDNIKNRIKDLHLYPDGREFEDLTADPLQSTRLPELTKLMEGKFRQHPGEFADIPEVSSFFRACSQLENGLKQLSSQRKSMQELRKKIDWAATISNTRTEEIKKVLNLEE